jgi:hypothetical protein
MTEFVAIDGEAIKTGEYVLMRDSLGREFIAGDGLATAEIFQWLLALDQGAGHRDREYVVFGLNYDVNQWLITLRPEQLRTLLDVGQITLWNRYEIHWMPAKAFELRDLKTRRWIKVCEVFGFFQSSFVRALQDWKFDPPERMTAMKGARNDFTARDIPQMSAYCLEECQYLERLMQRLADACERAGCTPSRNWWIGAGSVANALMRAHGVKEHVAHDDEIADQDIVEQFVLRAYFGGRVELLTQGTLPTCQTRDVRSAYPYAATMLPSLAGAELTYTDTYNPTAEHAIWRVRWHDQTHGQLAPFPCRTTGKSILYPASGEGAYHAVEVGTALALGYQLEILDGVELTVSAGQPFAFVPEVYAERARLKAAGDEAQKALKLGLNSVYGKLAQGYGRQLANGAVLPPPYQSYMWAGEITARTRARVLTAAHGATDVMMISTDGVFARRFDRQHRGTQQPALGSWEPGELTNLFCAMAGVYHAVERDSSKEIRKSRGFFARDIDYNDLRRVWELDGTRGQLPYTSRRFIGARVALARNRPELWRKWVDERRSINLAPDPSRKSFMSEYQPGDDQPFPLIEHGIARLYPPKQYVESVPYTPKMALYDLSPDIDEIEAMIGDDQPDFDIED